MATPRKRPAGKKLSALLRARIIELHETRDADGRPPDYRTIEKIMTAEGMPVSRNGISKTLRAHIAAVSEAARGAVVARVADSIDANIARVLEMTELLAKIAKDESEVTRDRVAAAARAADITLRLIGIEPDRGGRDIGDIEREANRVYGWDLEDEADAAAGGNGIAHH